MLFLSSNVYEAALRSYYSERYSTVGAAAADQIKAQAVEDYARQLELIHVALSPYVLARGCPPQTIPAHARRLVSG